VVSVCNVVPTNKETNIFSDTYLAELPIEARNDLIDAFDADVENRLGAMQDRYDSRIADTQWFIDQAGVA
jgi:hypothetical protein